MQGDDELGEQTVERERRITLELKAVVTGHRHVNRDVRRWYTGDWVRSAMRVLLIPLSATAIAQAGLAVVCFRRYPRARVPAASLACLALCYLLFATLGYDCLRAVHRPSSFDPLADWIDLMIQHIIVTGGLFATACAANIWLAFSIPVGTNAKGRLTVVDADAPQPVS